MWDEIKYLCKSATAGSKELKELERVKRLFEKAYRESGKTQKNTSDGGVRYKLSDLEIDRKYIEYTDIKHANAAIDEKVADLVSRGKAVELSADRISNYETGADWTNKKAVRDLLKGILKPFMGADAQFEYNGKTATAYLTKTGVNHSVGGNASPRKAVAFEEFNALVKNAEYAFSSNNDIHSKSEQNVDGDIEWDTFVSVGTVNGEEYPIVFKIRSIDSDIRSQIYEMATKKENGFSHSDGSKENQTDAHPNYGTSPLSKNNIAQIDEKSSGQYSLSDAGKRYDNGVALEETSADDLAPVRKDLIQKPEAPVSREDLAPVGENVRRNDGSAPQEAEAPVGDGLTQAQEEILQMPEENLYAEKLVSKWENSRAEAENLERLREEAVASYDRKVEALQAQYDGKRNKDTKTARELLRRIERLKRLRADADADYKNVIESGYREGAIKMPAFKMKTGRPDSQRLSGCYQCDSKWMLPGRICFHCPCLRTYCCA